MFREQYHSMNEQIYPEKELVYKIVKSAGQSQNPTIRAKNSFLKPAIIMAVVLVVVFTVTPVLSANVPAFYRLMYLVSPPTAQLFMPVQKSCVDNGVKMEVVSAYIHEDTAEIYITMQDLAGQRVDETIDLYDSYDINRPFDCSARCQRVDYDEQTKTATFLVTITQWGNQKIAGDKITFSVREFLSDKHEYNNIPISIDWSGIDTSPLVKAVSSGNNAKVLVPSAPMEFPVEGIDLTGIGYVDGMLHIQTAAVNSLTNDNHGFIFLVDKNGKKIDCNCNLYFVENYGSDNRIDYNEYIFDIPKSDIDQYSIQGDFTTSGLFTQGNWRVTFPLEIAK